jgi:hypothetical protein
VARSGLRENWNRCTCEPQLVLTNAVLLQRPLEVVVPQVGHHETQTPPHGRRRPCGHPVHRCTHDEFKVLTLTCKTTVPATRTPLPPPRYSICATTCGASKGQDGLQTGLRPRPPARGATSGSPGSSSPPRPATGRPSGNLRVTT